jgi:hypothetical protein
VNSTTSYQRPLFLTHGGDSLARIELIPWRGEARRMKGSRGFTYDAGVSKETVGASQICMFFRCCRAHEPKFISVELET